MNKTLDGNFKDRKTYVIHGNSIMHLTVIVRKSQNSRRVTSIFIGLDLRACAWDNKLSWSSASSRLINVIKTTFNSY